MLKLKCTAQNYAWGKYPPNSEVAELFSENNDVVVKEDTPYAEFWMGTHPNGPSLLKDTGELLQSWLQKHPEALGEIVGERFGDQLPFLFKVLSVRTALSIQSHPDKILAEKLHAQSPHIYKDANHKPEMAIALTQFECLCGFVSFDEIKWALDHFPELKHCLQQQTVQNIKTAADSSTEQQKALKAVFTELMLCSEDIYASQISLLIKRLSTKPSNKRLLKEKLLLRLHEQYPGDVGILAACLLNYMMLRPGSAIYLPANEPHAYLSGDLVECMATSDNVIRAGLTPKLRDAQVLCDSLTYSMGSPTVLEGEKVETNDLVYCPPFEEFEVLRVILEDASLVRQLPTNEGPSLLLVQKGKGKFVDADQSTMTFKYGDVFFMSAHTSVTIQKDAESVENVVIWLAMVNRSVFAR